MQSYSRSTTFRLRTTLANNTILNVGKLERALADVVELFLPGEYGNAYVQAAKCDPPEGKTGKFDGVLIVTNTRLLFSGRFLLSRSTSTHELSHISSISISRAVFRAHIQVMLAGGVENYLVAFPQGQEFVSKAQQFISAAQQQSHRLVQKTSSLSADKLLMLAKLQREGVISNAEFEAAKNAILDNEW